jgi:flagellar protein FlbD
MILATRLKGQTVALNPDLIESIEANPDTTIRFTSGEKLLVRESVEDIVATVIEYRRYVLSALTHPSSRGASTPPRPHTTAKE